MAGQLLTFRAAARYLGVGTDTFAQYVRDGVIPVWDDPVVPGKRRFAKPALDRWLAELGARARQAAS